MALRAGYFGLKRFEKNKLSILAASMPADIGPNNPIAGKNDVLTSVDLLKDTTGWTGKSKVPNTASSKSSGNVAFTVNENKTVQVVANNNSAYQALTINSNIGDYLEVGKTYTLCGTPLKPSGASYRQFELRIRKNSNNDVVAFDVGNSVEFTYTQEMAQADTYRLDIAIFDGTTYDGLFAPMITTPEEYKLSPAYEPYHESVEEMLTAKDVSVTAGTDVTVNTNTHVYSNAGIVSGSMRLEIGATLTAGATIATLSVKPKGTTYAIAIDNTDASVIPIIIGTNGAVQLFASFVPTEGHQLIIPLSFIDDPGTVTNREISADIEPEYKYQAKKATKKKVIKEEEE